MQILAHCGHHITQTGDERVDALPVRRLPSEGWTRVLEILVPDVQEGDILFIAGKVQRTNNMHKSIWSLRGGRNVGIGARLALVAPNFAEPIALTNWTGSNVDQVIHHSPAVEPINWRAPQTYGDVIVGLDSKASSLSAVTSGPKRWMIRVDRCYGHLSVEHVRPIEWPPAPSP